MVDATQITPSMIFAGIIVILFFIGVYIFVALSLIRIGKRLDKKNRWLAWIPIANIFLLVNYSEQKWYWGFLIFIPIANVVFLILTIWMIYEELKIPGELSLAFLSLFIPFIGWFGFIANMIILGIVSWKE